MMHKRLPITKKIILFFKFIIRNRYIPNIKRPMTFNEKIFSRIIYTNNSLFSECSDKLAVKDYIKKKGLDSIIIENVFISNYLTKENVFNALDDAPEGVMLKANHNSGPVFHIDSTTPKFQIIHAINSINKQLKLNYGLRYGESWYSNIHPKAFIEKLIKTKDGEELRDYKFHVFKQKNNDFKIILHVDFNRSTNHTRTYFDENLNYIPISSYAPSLIKNIEKPRNYSKMLKIAKELAEPFDYVRVDLYNIEGDIYFGELTFAQGAGLSKFGSKKEDLFLGSHWNMESNKWN
ncbi:glycosyltransferase [Vibrio alginolyticus]|uniref:ATP-grasp fold amidoligase family protein n=1 Tax=Vibrio alginolyticus TaxID=663 RepID=UPI001BD2B2D6|nr:ATP-grasp fold amidoligase family protein [Vibrio alginolyticus]MBS9950502.1 glycosyltransferase [Vibrio alginolyticus]